MTLQYANIAVHVLTMIMMTGISTSFFLSAYWNTRYLLIVKNKSFCWLKANLAIASSLMVFIYIYLFTKLLMGEPVFISNFSNIIIRPVILYLGCTIAAGARARYLSAKEGE